MHQTSSRCCASRCRTDPAKFLCARQPLYTSPAECRPRRRPQRLDEYHPRLRSGRLSANPGPGEVHRPVRPLLATARNRPPAVAITSEPVAARRRWPAADLPVALRGATVAVIDRRATQSRWSSPYSGRATSPGTTAELAAPAAGPFSFGVDLSRSGPWPRDAAAAPAADQRGAGSAMIQAVGAVAERTGPAWAGRQLPGQADNEAWKSPAGDAAGLGMRLARLCCAPSVDRRSTRRAGPRCGRWPT